MIIYLKNKKGMHKGGGEAKWKKYYISSVFLIMLGYFKVKLMWMLFIASVLIIFNIKTEKLKPECVPSKEHAYDMH